MEHPWECLPSGAVAHLDQAGVEAVGEDRNLFFFWGGGFKRCLERQVSYFFRQLYP